MRHTADVEAVPHLVVGGCAYQRGLEHGRAFAGGIAHNLEAYLRRFQASGLTRDTAFAEASRWWKAIEDTNGEYAEEMAGIAAGSGMAREPIALLNARYELAFTLFGSDARNQALDEAGGCSTFAALPEVTADGGTWLGQNWDWLASIHGHAFVLEIRRDHAPDLVCLTEAGIVGGKMGVNSSGIGLAENGLASDHDGRNPYRKPFHVRCREILDCERMENALRVVVAEKRTCSANFVIGHADGEAVNIETSPDHVSYRYPNHGLTTHANHFMDPGHGESQMEKISPSTLYRAERLDRLLRARTKLDLSGMSGAFADHFGWPGSICRHVDDGMEAAKQTMTLASVLIDLPHRTMHMANGPPCERPYLPFGLNGRSSNGI